MSVLRIYNSLSRKTEIFKPRSGKLAKLYTCGPTVYSRAHIGNLRTYSYEDTMKRYLLYSGFKVKHVMNITDFDSTVLREVRKTGIPRKQLTKKFEKIFRHDIAKLGIIPAMKYPHVSQFAEKMAQRVKMLLKNGFAYQEEDGTVYFDVSKYPSYGKLVGRNLSRATRKVSLEEYKPFKAGDFMLWDPCTHQEQHDSFRTSLGVAHPAWNVQCAVMSTEAFRGAIDLAMGGRDNLFNHHENTRAVAYGTLHSEYSKYWMHVRHLLLNGEKMSKTKKNTVSLSDMEGKGFSPKIVRMVLVSVHYRKRLDFTWDYAHRIKERYGRMKESIVKIKGAAGRGAENFAGILTSAQNEFETAMDDDLNVPKAFAAIEKFLAKCNGAALSRKESGQAIALLEKFDSVLACLPL